MTDLPPPPEPGSGVPPGPGSGVPSAQYPPTPPLAPPPSPVPPGAIRAVGQWPGSTDDVPPPRKVPFWVVALAIVAVGAILGGLFAVVSDDGQNDGDDVASFERDTTTTEPSDESPPGTEPEATLPSSEFQAVVEEIEDFVAAERGLPFLRPVIVELADDAEFEQRLLEDFDEEVAEIETTGHVLRALGLLAPGTDLVAGFRSLLGAGVVGFYDPETDELVVRGTSASPYVRAVIAHELVHALDDQHFELDRPELEDVSDETGFGFTALVEGNASRVEAAYRATFSTAEESEARAEESQIGAGYDFDEIPLTLFESIAAPYLLGPTLVEHIIEAGGQELLDAAFADPPATSEALLDPDVYVQRQPVLPVPAPAADGAEIDRHVIGAMGLAQLLGELSFILSGFGELSPAVEGWGGDAYVAWLDGSRACVRANLVGDSATDTAEIAAALQEWSASPPFDVVATVAVGEVVTLTSCG